MKINEIFNSTGHSREKMKSFQQTLAANCDFEDEADALEGNNSAVEKKKQKKKVE